MLRRYARPILLLLLAGDAHSASCPTSATSTSIAIQSGAFTKPAAGSVWLPNGNNWRDIGSGGTPGSLQLTLGSDGQKDQRARMAASFVPVDGIPINVQITMKAAPAKSVASTFALSTGPDKCDAVRFSIVPQGQSFDISLQ